MSSHIVAAQRVLFYSEVQVVKLSIFHGKEKVYGSIP